MKYKISVTIEEDLLPKILEKKRKNKLLRSKSQVVEEALKMYLEDEDDS